MTAQPTEPRLLPREIAEPLNELRECHTKALVALSTLESALHSLPSLMTPAVVAEMDALRRTTDRAATAHDDALSVTARGETPDAAALSTATESVKQVEDDALELIRQLTTRVDDLETRIAALENNKSRPGSGFDLIKGMFSGGSQSDSSDDSPPTASPEPRPSKRRHH